MLSSLPSLTPLDPSELWYMPLIAPSSLPPPPSSSFSSSSGPGSGGNNNNGGPSSRQAQAQREAQREQAAQRRGGHGIWGTGGTRTQLGELRADEAAIAARKGNIARFGAGWLRPPGVGKTLQGLWDEKAEREEAEQAALREQALADAQAAQEEAEREAQFRLRAAAADAGEAGGEGGEDEMGGDRDLDDDIPEGLPGDDDEDDENDDDGDDEDGQWEDEGEDDEDDDGAFVGMDGEGDYGEEGGADVLPLGMHADLDLMAGRDLDDDVPDAGSYEHTDTDAEDDSDIEVDDETRLSLAVPGAAEIGTSAIMGGASFGSSPVARSRRAPRRSSGYPGRQ